MMAGEGEKPSGGPAPHIPVMLAEVLEALSPQDNDIIIDGTFGAGGYTRAILDAANCRVIAFDRDETAISAGQALVDAYKGRLTLIHDRFSRFADHLDRLGIEAVDGLVLDIGVSSMQIDRAERGFSFQKDGPLDMRMGQEGETSADLINSREEKEIADILYQFGEERKSRAIARAIVREREKKPFSTTLELADLVQSVLGRRPQDKVHPATRTFQALRIAVNEELTELRETLETSEKKLKPGARLVVVSFHSLEDRIVKEYLHEKAGGQAPSRHMPHALEAAKPLFTLMKRGAMKAGESETAHNPRARSARLRAALRTDAGF